MENEFIICNNKLVSYAGNGISITIPVGITRIGAGAFKGKSIEQIQFEGTSLKSIDEEAFADCKTLKSILIPDGVVQIGDHAFIGCKAMLYIRIPSSVLLVGEDVLSGHNSDLVIIGEKGTEAETIATKYGVILQDDEQRAIKAVQAAIKWKSSAETRTFEILGETITCSNTLAKYQAAIEYYASRKEPFFASYIKQFPNALNARIGNMLTVFEPETNRTVDRLAKQGVLTTRDAISNRYLLAPYQMTVNSLKAIFDLQKAANEAASSGISSMQEQLAREAESKVTGLSYGILGDGLDLLAYSIDDFRERQRQRKAAYTEAERKYDQYKRDQVNQGDKLIADTMKQIIPTLRKVSDLFVEKLLEAEIDLLTDAGIIEANATNGIDTQKSAQLVQSIVDKRGDNSFAAVLAIKKYPCNIAALAYVLERNPACEQINDLINFLGLAQQVKQGLVSGKQRRINNYQKALSKVSSANQGFALIAEDNSIFEESDIQKLYRVISKTITQKIESEIFTPISLPISNTKEFCVQKISRILSREDWNRFEQYKVTPIQSDRIPNEAKISYDALLEWSSNDLLKRTNTIEEKYQAALNTQNKAKTAKELKYAADQYADLVGYKDSRNRINDLQQKAEEKEKNKKKSIGFLFVSLVVIAIVVAICFVSASKNAPFRELKAALDDGSFSSEWRSSEGLQLVSNYDRKGMQVVANKLGEYHNNNDVENALKLLSEILELGVEIDGEYFYASHSFIDWIKDYAIINGAGNADSEGKYRYNVMGYSLDWNSRSWMNQLYLNGKIIMVNNPYYKTSLSDKVEIP